MTLTRWAARIAPRVIAPLVIAPLVIASLASAQPAAPPKLHAAPAAAGRTVPLLPPLQFERLGLEEGLPQISVNAVTQDQRGFVWLGTQSGGLVQFDGTTMVQYPSIASDASTVGSQFITALESDLSGRVWVGTGDAGLSVYDPATDRFTRYRADATPTAIASDAVTVLTFGADGALWVGFGTGAVDRVDAATGVAQHVVPAEFSRGEISAIQADGRERLLVSSNGGGIMAITSLASAPKPAWLPNNDTLPHDLTSFLLDRSGTLWLGTASSGLLRLPPGGAPPLTYLPQEGDRRSLSNPKITALLEDRNGTLWVGTQLGLNAFDASRTRITRYAPDAEFPLRTTTYPTYVTAQFEDRSGTLWFGTLDFGVHKFDPMRRAFHSYVGPGELGIPMAYCEASDGSIWGGTYSNGLYHFDFANEQYTEYTSLGEGSEQVPLNVWLTSLHCAKDGTIWIGGSGLGLISLDPATSRFTHYVADEDGQTGPTSDRIEHIVEGPDGALWLATWGGGLNRFDRVTRTFEVVVNDERVLPSQYLHRILFDAANPKVLWVGAELGGLARLDLTTKTSKLFRGPHSGEAQTTGGLQLPSDSVQTLHQTPDGIVWAGTSGGGLARLDPTTDKTTAYGEAQGVPRVIYGILPDDAGSLWMTTAKGLIKLDPKTGATVKFTAQDGLVSTEFSQNGYLRTRSGEFLVTGLTGFNRFSPKEITPDTVVPPVVLTGFKLFGKAPNLPRPIWNMNDLRLSYRDSVITIEFAALGFVAPRRTQYSYKLEGFRDEWLTTDRGELTFTNLDSGKYVLKIRATNRHGVTSETPTTLSFRIAAPFWRTKLAYAVYMLLLIGSGAFVVYAQRQRLIRAQREGRLAIVENDLKLTGAVQSGFLPAENRIESGQMKLVGFYRPADVCSGDWWWHERLDNGRHLILVGDVTGHGPGPAMVTAAVATAFHVATLIQCTAADMLRLLNREVLRVAKGKYQMTLVLVEIDDETGEWNLHSAGAPPLLTLDRDGKHRVRFCPGNVLGTDGTFEAGELSGQLQPGERMLLFTDGIPEVEGTDGATLGLRRLAQFYEGTKAQPLTEAAAAIVRHADQVRGTAVQADDWTFAIIEWGGLDPIGR